MQYFNPELYQPLFHYGGVKEQAVCFFREAILFSLTRLFLLSLYAVLIKLEIFDQNV